jgi:hypothetical protein
MKRKLTYALILLTCTLLCKQVRAQATPDNSLSQPERSAVALYNKTMGDRLSVYRGPAVLTYTLRSATNPNFRDTTDYFEDGTINYDNRVYYHVPLLYNVERDLLQSRVNSSTPYSLLSDRVVDFDMLGRHFIRFIPEKNNKIMMPGFYGVLYNGKIEVMGRYQKTVQSQATNVSTINVFYPKTNYFVKKGAAYYNVNSKSKFLDALADKKKELQQFIKENKIDFSDNPERSMVILAAYYDRLTN